MIGHKMIAAAEYVRLHPGCCKLEVATHVQSQSPTRYGFPIVNRAIRDGLITVDRYEGGRYYLVAPDEGRTG